MINIGIYGNVNAGKSSLLNYLIGVEVAIVSDVAGTTTDVVKRSFELPGVGAVTFFDTAGVNDSSVLARERVGKTYDTIESVDLAIVIEDGEDLSELYNRLEDVPIIKLKKHHFPPLVELYSLIKSELADLERDGDFFGGRVTKGEVVVFVCPIDSGAPSGRLILPQVQALRAALDMGVIAVAVQVEQVEETLEKFSPKLVVTDAQVYDSVSTLVYYYTSTHKKKIELTSFSALLAESKGDVKSYQRGLERVKSLKVGDRVLVVEYCSHHASCEDVGRVKIPKLLNEFVGGELSYDFVTGRAQLPQSLDKYAIAIQCGGCMTGRRQIINRIKRLNRAKVEVVNYGMLLRSLLTFKKS